MVKKYILSIDSEAKEYFDKNLLLIETQLKEGVLGTPLVSSNKYIVPIVEKGVREFIQTAISLVDYYVEGIYDSGKKVSRKKLKLKNQTPQDGKRYSFTRNDETFIDKYKTSKLTSLNMEFDKAVSDYVVEKITEKMQSKWKFSDDEDSKAFDYSKQELVDDEMKGIIDIVKNSITDVYDELMDMITREILVLFKRAQIEEFKNLGINTITIIAEDESLCCPVCTAKSGKVSKIDETIDEYGLRDGTRHSFCKYSIDPVISYQNQLTTINPFSEVSIHSEYNSSFDDSSIRLNNEIKTNVDLTISSIKFTNVPIEVEYRVTKLLKKFQIYAKQFLREIEFIFVDNITEENDWFQSVKNHYIQEGKNDFEATNEALRAQDNLKFKVASFDFDDKYYVSVMSFDSQLVEEIITRKMVKDNLVISNWVNERYEEKQKTKHIGNGIVIYEDPFISYLSQETPEDYLLESVVAYINQPKKLEELDKKIFDYIKENVFNNIQFFQ